jgi:hypothetical protein
VNNEEKILTILERMETDIGDIKQRMDRMETEVSDIKLTTDRIDFTTRRTWTHLIKHEIRLHEAEDKLKQM